MGHSMTSVEFSVCGWDATQTWGRCFRRTLISAASRPGTHRVEVSSGVALDRGARYTIYPVNMLVLCFLLVYCEIATDVGPHIEVVVWRLDALGDE